MVNSLKEKLLKGECVFGTWIETSSVDNAEILAQVGVDFIMIDGEHGAMNFETAGKMISQIKYTKTVPLLRVPWNNIDTLKQYLDTGTSGVMIPMINSKEDALKAVSYCNYPPKGVRGFGIGRNTLFSGKMMEYLNSVLEENNIIVIVQIEHIDAVNNIDEILSVPGIDVAFIGPFDLSASMGILGRIEHPKVLEAIDKVLLSCKKHNIVSGIITTPEKMKQHISQGFRMLLAGNDGQFLFEGGQQMVSEFKKALQNI